MSKHSYGANSEMLLLLAWLSTLDVQDQARQDRKARPQKYPHRQTWDDSRLPVFPEECIHQQITKAMEYFKFDPVYGPVLEALVRYRLNYIDFSLVAWAIELKGLADASSGLFFSDDHYYSVHRQSTAFIDETDAFWKATLSHPPLMDRLNRLSKTWHGNVCRGACELRSFFGWYLALIQWSLQIPFFLAELAHKSLLKIDWHRIATSILEIPLPSQGNCHCALISQQVSVGATAAYLGEVFRVTGNDILLHGQHIPEPERTQALLLADLCRETARVMQPSFKEHEHHEGSSSPGKE